VISAGKNWGEAILAFLHELAARLKRCVSERSFSPLWGVTWDPICWCEEVRVTMQNYPLLTTSGDASPDVKERFKMARENGLPPWWTTPVSPEEFLARFTALLDRGLIIVRTLGSLKA
jgi:hypothetical protein